MNTPTMNRSAALFFQLVIVLLGVGVLALMLVEPHLEGRNAHATTFEIYFKDPFLAYVYLGSIPFFVALWRAFGLLGDVRQTGAFSQGTVSSLRFIRRCALVLVALVAGATGLILTLGDGEDRPGGLFMCVLAAGGASVVALVAAKLARSLQGVVAPDVRRST